MERLSDKAIEIINELHAERLDYESEYLPLIDCAQQCDAYEDTGLTPEEIERVLDAYGRGMTLRAENAERLRLVKDISTDRLKELAQAEWDGRLVVLPNDGWLIKILEERDRQDQKWGVPQENTCGEWGSILAEETGELAKELNELNFGRGDIERMEAEAVQVAAVALAILEQSGVALKVTEQVAKALRRVPDRPKCFYGDTDLCLGMSVNNDDEPIEACKRCRWCSAGYHQLEAEEAVERKVARKSG